MKRGGGQTNNGVITSSPVVVPPLPLPSPSADSTPHASEKAAPTVPESSPRDLRNNNNNNNNVESGSKEPLVPHFHGGNSHPRSSYRRGNGSGHYHNNYGNRRDHDHRPNHDWHPHRNFHSRDGRMQHQRFPPRNFHRPPPVSPVFVGPSPIRAYGNPVGYPGKLCYLWIKVSFCCFIFGVNKIDCFSEMPSPYFFVPPPPPPPPPESFRGMPYAHVVPPVVYYPQQDSQLHSKLVTQIDYYFRYFQHSLACFWWRCFLSSMFLFISIFP